MKKGKNLALIIHFVAVIITLVFVILAICGYKTLWWVALGALCHYVCSSIIHELGHLIVIKYRRCKIVGWNILGFYNDRTTDTCGYSVVNYAGSISYVSTNPDHAKEDLKKVSLGGVVANGVYLIICCLVGFIVHDKIVTYMLLFGSYISCYMVLINLLPLREDGDGSIYFGIQGNEKRYQTTINLAKILAYLYKGYSPKEIPEELYEITEGYLSDGVKYYKMLYCIQVEKLREAYELAIDLQEDNENQIAPHRLYLAIRLNYSTEIFPLSGSIAYLEQDSAQYFRINGTYRRYCHDEEWADLCKTSGLKAAEGEFFRGIGKLEKELIELI